MKLPQQQNEDALTWLRRNWQLTLVAFDWRARHDPWMHSVAKRLKALPARPLASALPTFISETGIPQLHCCSWRQLAHNLAQQIDKLAPPG
jgi:hypothetical protein